MQKTLSRVLTLIIPCVAVAATLHNLMLSAGLRREVERVETRDELIRELQEENDELTEICERRAAESVLDFAQNGFFSS